MAEGNMIRIVIDDREKNGAMLNCLRNTPNVEVQIRRLTLGDYLLPNLIVERKSLFDFCESIKNGRLFRQVGNLANSKLQPLIILEIASNVFQKPNITVEALRGALTIANATPQELRLFGNISQNLAQKI